MEDLVPKNISHKLDSLQEGDLDVTIKHESFVENIWETNLKDEPDYVHYHDIHEIKLEKEYVEDEVLKNDIRHKTGSPEEELSSESIEIKDEDIDDDIYEPNSEIDDNASDQDDIQLENTTKSHDAKSDKIYETSTKLMDHCIKNHGMNKLDVDNRSSKYCCKICNKLFSLKSNYDRHVNRKHNSEKKFECHLCPKKFIDEYDLQMHLKTHSSVKEFKCAHCASEYKFQKCLKVHMAKVHGIGVGEIKILSKKRKYSCHICHKSFNFKSRLKRHSYIHTGEKPFDCPICGNKFKDKNYARTHLWKMHNVVELPQGISDSLSSNERHSEENNSTES